MRERKNGIAQRMASIGGVKGAANMHPADSVLATRLRAGDQDDGLKYKNRIGEKCECLAQADRSSTGGRKGDLKRQPRAQYLFKRPTDFSFNVREATAPFA